MVLPSSCADARPDGRPEHGWRKVYPRPDRGEPVARGGIEPERPHCATCRRQLCRATVPPSATALVADDDQRQTWATIRSGLSAGLQQAVDLGHQWSQATPEVGSTRRDS